MRTEIRFAGVDGALGNVAGHIHIETGVCGGISGVCGEPIRDDVALESQFAFKNIVE